MVRLSFQGGGSLQRERPLQGTGWLTRERMIAYATILAIVEMGLFAFCVAGSHGLIVPLDHQPSTDFVSFYAAGALADAGVPLLAYDHAAHHAAEHMNNGSRAEVRDLADNLHRARHADFAARAGNEKRVLNVARRTREHVPADDEVA